MWNWQHRYSVHQHQSYSKLTMDKKLQELLIFVSIWITILIISMSTVWRRGNFKETYFAILLNMSTILDFNWLESSFLKFFEEWKQSIDLRPGNFKMGSTAYLLPIKYLKVSKLLYFQLMKLQNICCNMAVSMY